LLGQIRFLFFDYFSELIGNIGRQLRKPLQTDPE
jgi:hypothetical protein